MSDHEIEFTDDMVPRDLFDVESEVDEVNIEDEPFDDFEKFPPKHTFAARRMDQEKKRETTGMPPRPIAEPTGDLEMDVVNLREACSQMFYSVCTLFEIVKALQATHPGLFEDSPDEKLPEAGAPAAPQDPTEKHIAPSVNRILIICLGANMLITILMMLIYMIR